MIAVDVSLLEVYDLLQMILVVALLVVGILFLFQARQWLRGKTRLIKMQRLNLWQQTLRAQCGSAPVDVYLEFEKYLSSHGWDVKA